MILAAIIIFLITAVFGAIIVFHILKDRPTPKSIVIIHGPLAAIGLLLLIIYIVIGHNETLPIISLILFIIAAGGGYLLYSLDTLKKHLPKSLAIIHPIIAFAGVVVLIIYAL